MHEVRTSVDFDLISTGLHELSELHQKLGHFKEAEDYITRALAIRRRIFGEHIDVSKSLSNLALLKMSQANYEEAQKLQEEALSILEKILGKHHAKVEHVVMFLKTVIRLLKQFIHLERSTTSKENMQKVRKDFERPLE